MLTFFRVTLFRKPTLPENDFHILLTLRLPPALRAKETASWLSLICNIADVINKKDGFVPAMQVNKLVRQKLYGIQVRA